MNGHLLNIKQAADAAGVSRVTIYTWIGAGLPVTTVAHVKFIRLSDLRKFAKRRGKTVDVP